MNILKITSVNPITVNAYMKHNIGLMRNKNYKLLFQKSKFKLMY